MRIQPTVVSSPVRVRPRFAAETPPHSFDEVKPKAQAPMDHLSNRRLTAALTGAWMFGAPLAIVADFAHISLMPLTLLAAIGGGAYRYYRDYKAEVAERQQP